MSANSITGHDLGSGMLTTPIGEGGGFSVGQKIDDAVLFEVDKDGTVSLTAAPRPVVGAQNARRPYQLGWRVASEKARQCVTAHRHDRPEPAH